MASQKRSLADRMLRWRALITNGKKAFPGELPQAVPDIEELERVVAELWRLHCEQERLAAEHHIATRRAQELGRTPTACAAGSEPPCAGNSASPAPSSTSSASSPAKPA